MLMTILYISVKAEWSLNPGKLLLGCWNDVKCRSVLYCIQKSLKIFVPEPWSQTYFFGISKKLVNNFKALSTQTLALEDSV